MSRDNGKRPERVPRKVYEKELLGCRSSWSQMQYWVRNEGARVVVVFEGRDAAGKGGTIKRITEHLNPRVARIVALPAPTEREQSQWYFQRYVAHLPAAGEIVLFDRSWYNRAGVERVMGSAPRTSTSSSCASARSSSGMLVEDGILLISTGSR